MAGTENLKSLRELKRRLSKRDWDRLEAKLLNAQEIREFRNYDYGLTTEEEFRFILQLLMHVGKVEPIEQAGRAPGQPIPPDYLVVFKKHPKVRDDDQSATFPALVEVKRAWSSTGRWKISRNDFVRREKYAVRRGMRLFFAVKFASAGWALWTMFPSTYVKSRKLHLDIGDLRNSVFDLFTGNLQLHLPECKVEMVFDRERSGPVIHPERGGLVELRVHRDGSIIETKHSTLWRWLLFAFSPTTTTESKEGLRTTVTKSYHSQMVPLYHAVDALMCVLHQLEDETQKVNFRLDWLEGKTKSLVTVEAVGGLALDMMDAGALQPFRLMPADL